MGVIRTADFCRTFVERFGDWCENVVGEVSNGRSWRRFLEEGEVCAGGWCGRLG